MKKYIFIFALIILILIPINIKANCNYEDQSALNKLASHVNYDYEYVGGNFFNVTISNVTNDLKLLYNNKYYTNLNGKVVLYNLKNNDENNIIIYSTESSRCPNISIRTLYIKLPYYNQYSEREECKEYSSFDVCSKFVKKQISQDEFEQAIEKKELQEEIEKFIKENQENNFKKQKFVLSKLNISLVISAGIILIIITMLILKLKKIKKAGEV